MFDWEEGFIFDIVFLDIQMDKQTGMDIAQKIRKKNENAIIVFVTNFIDYVLLCTLIM